MLSVILVTCVLRFSRAFFTKSVRYRLPLLVFTKAYCSFEETGIIFIELIFFHVISFVSVHKEHLDEIFAR